MLRYRKNIDCLTTDELHDLREALAAMIVLPSTDANSFTLLASLHGGPPTAYCRHGEPGFFTWHRAYIKAFEDALGAVGCQVMLPFWDWSSGPSTGVPPACREATYVNRNGTTVPNPLFSGPRAAGGQTARRPDIDTTAYDDLAAGAQTAMTATAFSSFQNQISGVHGGVHVRTGGDMSSVPTAAYDPIFYLHHANVDRIWARWQALHPGSTPSGEASFALEPFNRPFSAQWQTGADVESTDALGYRYRTFCFYLPPIRLWEVALIRVPIWVRERMTSARLIVRSHHMQPLPFEVRVFLDQPRATPQTKTIGNPSFAGTFGFLGHGPMERPAADPIHCPECAALGNTMEHAQHVHVHGDHPVSEPARSEAETFDVEVDLTDAVRKLDRDSEEVGLKLVAVDVNGDPVTADDVVLDEIEFAVD